MREYTNVCQHSTTKRILSFCLALVMVLTLLPASALLANAVSAGDTLYFCPSTDWMTASPRFAAYFFNNAGGTGWASMSDTDGDGYYSVTIPTGNFTNVIFVRMNPANTTNNWDNKWNQTADLTIPTDSKNCFTIPNGVWDGANGTWSVYGGGTDVTDPTEDTDVTDPTQGTTGEKSNVALAGAFNGWSTTAYMDVVNDVTVTTTMTLSADSYEFKIVEDGTWLGNMGVIEDTTTTTSPTGWKMSADDLTNCTLKASGGTYTFTFYTDTNMLIVTHESSGGGESGGGESGGGESGGGESGGGVVVTTPSDIQNGTTLHCWNWSFAAIEANMAKIAEQGFTAIQTSPVQTPKEATNTNSVGSHWWVYYQPCDFNMTTMSGNALGTKDDFISMAKTAEEYGIKVIVDVVANHLGNKTGNDLADTIPSNIRNNAAYWHDIKTNTSNYSDRYDITQHCMGGLPDLNTGNKDVQNFVLNFLKECIDAGADGFRFDAAKHIETPQDSGCASDFWPTVINGATAYAESKGVDLYCYGEILDGTGGVSISAYTQYMSITDNQYGNSLRGNVNSGNAGGYSSYYPKGTTANKLVLWAESHDTYANDSHESTYVSVDKINKTWALVAARADAMGLYFARPEKTSQLLGVGSVTGWSYDVVKEANLFHNAFVGKTEYVANQNGIAYCERGTEGVVLVNVGGGSTSVNVTANKMAAGTYKDQLTGNTFTVANGKISGTIGSTGVAVVYNAECETHSWNNGTCSVCGKTCDHAEHTQTGACTVCGATVDHSYESVVTPPTCTAGGYTTYTCDCGHSYTGDETPAADHNYVDGTCTACGGADPDYVKPVEKFDIAMTSMTMGNSLAMNIAFEQAEVSDWTGHYAVITKTYADGRENVVETVALADWKSANIGGVAHYYVTFNGIAAKEMTDDINVVIYNANDEAVSNVYTDSVAAQSARILAKDTTSDEEKTMIVDMLNYGAAAQEYFGYGTDKLANADLTEEQKAYASEAKACTDIRVKGDNYVATNVVLKSNIQMMFAFQNIDTTMTAKVTFTNHRGVAKEVTISGSDFTKNGNFYVVTVDALVVADGRQAVTCVIYDADGNQVANATDSLESYTARKNGAEDIFVKMMQYSDSAYAYFH